MSFILNEIQCNNLHYKNNYPKTTKARIIPYYVENNKLYYLLCEEKRKISYLTNDLYKSNYSFFIKTYNILGGHRESNETILQCAKRELEEETLNTISFNNYSQIIKRNKRYIIFIPINECPINIFNKRKNDLISKPIDYLKNYLPNLTEDNYEHYNEINNLKWIESSKINSPYIYQSVRDIFQDLKLFNNQQISLEIFENDLKLFYSQWFSQFNFTPFYYTFQQCKPIMFESYFCTTT